MPTATDPIAADPAAADTAVFFHPAEGDFNLAWAAQAFEHCENRGYRCTGVVRDWDAAIGMLATRTARVIVVARREHVRPEWLPRIEVAGDGPLLPRAARILATSPQQDTSPRAESLADAPPPSVRGSRGAWAKGQRRPQLLHD